MMGKKKQAFAEKYGLEVATKMHVEDIKQQAKAEALKEVQIRFYDELGQADDTVWITGIETAFDGLQHVVEEMGGEAIDAIDIEKELQRRKEV